MTEIRGASQIQYEIRKAYESYKDKNEILELYKAVDNLEETNPAQNEQTYLHLAANYAHPEAIEYLLEQGLKPNAVDSHGYTPLQRLAECTHKIKFEKRDPEDIDKCVDLLLKARASVLLKDTGGGEKLCYHRAVEAENFRFVYALIRNKDKLNMPDKNGKDIFYYILWNPARSAKDSLRYTKDAAGIQECEDMLEECFKLTKALMDYGLDPENSGEKAIELKLDKLALLLKGEYDETDENLQDKLLAGGKNLHQACQEGNVEAVKALIRLGADVNEVFTEPDRTFKDKTPLAIACIYAFPDCVEALLEAEADPNFRGGEKGCSAFHYMMYDGEYKEYTQGKDKPIQKIIKLFLNKGWDINGVVNDILQSPIVAASDKAHWKEPVKTIVREELINNSDCDFNIPDKNGMTALMYMATQRAYKGFDNNLPLMLEYGADTTLKDKDGNTVLMHVAKNKDFNWANLMADLLFEFSDPLPQETNNEGKTALDYAVENNNEKLVKLILGKM